MSLTLELSNFALHDPSNKKNSEGISITDTDRDAAKLMLIDALGCAMAGWQADGCQAVIQQMCHWGGRGEANILFSGDAMPAPNAAFANSTLIHAQDLDDIYIPGTLHISSIVVPAMLAASQMSHANGKATLDALAMGVEIAARIENAGRDHRRGQGFLPSSLAGSFGGVITAATLLRLTAKQCMHAMGINYAQLAGNRQALYDSSLTKRMQPAMAVRSAIWSTQLAQRGLTGPHMALEGNAGYYQLYLDMPTPPTSKILTSPTDAMEIQRVAYKRYPSCGASHPAQMATEQLVVEEKIKPHEITRIQIFGQAPGGIVSRPFIIGSNPQVDAQFSVAWAVAHTLLRGKATLEDYRSERVAADKQVIALAQTVTYTDMPNDLPPELPIPQGYNKYNVQWQGLIVTTHDGRRLMRYYCPAVTFAPGNFNQDQIIEKFKQCADFSGICSDIQAQTIVNHILSLDQAADLSPLLASLCLPSRTTTQGTSS